MSVPGRLARPVFGTAMVAFGVQAAVYGDGVFGLEPFPAWLPAHTAWAWLSALALVASGAALIAGRWQRAAAFALGGQLSLWVLLLHVPRLAAHPGDGGMWTTALETLALCMAAWLASPPRGVVAGVARRVFGVAVLGFGVLHFVYHAYVASVIPGWIPGHLAWAYLTGVAFFAAGASIVTGVQARLAATLLGTMFGLWVLLVHAPRVAASLHDRAELTSLIVAWAMCGASWVLLAGRDAETEAAPGV